MAAYLEIQKHHLKPRLQQLDLRKVHVDIMLEDLCNEMHSLTTLKFTKGTYTREAITGPAKLLR